MVLDTVTGSVQHYREGQTLTFRQKLKWLIPCALERCSFDLYLKNKKNVIFVETLNLVCITLGCSCRTCIRSP